jgi:serine/threonine-protein kinase
MVSLAPKTLLSGRYRLEEQIAAGGMGTVWRAHDELLQRDVAVKLLRDSLADDDLAAERFRREALTAAAITHPNMANVYDYLQEDGRPGIVMELVDGETLAQRLAREGALPPADAIAIGVAVLEALAAAHEAGIVHRDIKPANILLPVTGGVKVTDFGIARSLSDTQLTSTGTVLGTAHYSAPEQVRGEPSSPATDVYALGVVLYEMLSGARPFDADTAIAVAMKRLNEDPAPLRALAPQVSLATEDVVMRALARAPSARYETADAMGEALAASANAPAPTEAFRAAPGDPTIAYAPVAAAAAAPAVAAAGVADDARPVAERVEEFVPPAWVGRRLAKILVPALALCALAGATAALLGANGNTPAARARSTASSPAAASTPSDSPQPQPVSVALVEVPDVTGMNLDEAMAALRSVHLVPYYRHFVTPGMQPEIVFEQSVGGGTSVDRGTRVDLKVTRAPWFGSDGNGNGNGKKKYDGNNQQGD